MTRRTDAQAAAPATSATGFVGETCGTTLGQALAEAAARLRAAAIPDAGRDARRLLADAAGVNPDRLTLHLSDPLTQAAAGRFAASVDARLARQPVSQITGFRSFWGRRFRVTPDVLDPRPETETLIAAALGRPARRVLDIGTGSGCILLTLLSEWRDATGIGTDASARALDVARANADALGIGARAGFRLTDWASGVSGAFDLIVSNPPYIDAAEIATLAPEVREWEPHMALTPGPDGLSSYRALLPMAVPLLAPGGRVLLETGPAQGRAVAALGHSFGLKDAEILPDLDGRDRVVAFFASAGPS